MSKIIDLTGQKFGKLTVVKRAGSTKDGRAQWLCKCDCGNTCIVMGKLLRNGSVKSCGCYQKDHPSHKSYNNYYIVGDIVYVQYRKSYDCFICDLDDWEKVKDMCWYKTSDYPYSKTSPYTDGIVITKLIMDCPDGMIVDHINGNVWDNRKCNLRVVANSQNGMNRGVPENNTSGHKGVTWYKTRNKWMAQIFKEGKRYFLGYFDNIEDAIKARENAEIELFGDYSVSFRDTIESVGVPNE